MRRCSPGVPCLGSISHAGSAANARPRRPWPSSLRPGVMAEYVLRGQCAPPYRERLTYPSPTTGQPVSLAFIQPRSVDDLVRRRIMFKTWADHTGGMLGRSPDYLNAILAGLASAHAYFDKNGPEYGER